MLPDEPSDRLSRSESVDEPFRRAGRGPRAPRGRRLARRSRWLLFWAAAVGLGTLSQRLRLGMLGVLGIGSWR
ncbi:MAG: hypothetical protein IT580_14365 [Verrucomicrobiales bacterium]|nr:hypothetical protein [Verrucomicrobiales bacterium]